MLSLCRSEGFFAEVTVGVCGRGFCQSPRQQHTNGGYVRLGPKAEVTSSFTSSVMSIIAFWNVFEAIRKAMQALYALRL